MERIPADFNAYYHTSSDRTQYFNQTYFNEMTKASVATFAHMAGIRTNCYWADLDCSGRRGYRRHNENGAALAGSGRSVELQSRLRCKRQWRDRRDRHSVVCSRVGLDSSYTITTV